MVQRGASERMTQEGCEDWYEQDDEGCCLICEKAEEGCLCFDCKCSKCYWYDNEAKYFGGRACEKVYDFKRRYRFQKEIEKINNFEKRFPKTSQKTIIGTNLRKNTKQYWAFEKKKEKK